MKVLITGANGFIGKNLRYTLEQREDVELYLFDIDTPIQRLDDFCADCNFVFNLAGVNRPENEEDFLKGNFGFASTLLDTLMRHNNNCPVMLSSSTHALTDNAYGKSKKAGEDLFFKYGEENEITVYVFRFPNVFGKWCRPNYNSAIATFCHNVANNLPITVTDPNLELTLVYIDDLVDTLMRCLNGELKISEDGFSYVPVTHHQTLGEIVALLESYKEDRNTLLVPKVTEDSFSHKLYSTYLSYLPKDKFSYPVKMNSDNRGSFTELLKTVDNGQVSVNISKPGIEKGNHWHHTKTEKFIVVNGEALVQFRKIDSDEIIDYHISGNQIEIVDIPPGYTHNIINVGDADLITVMWANECFNPDKPDTIFLKVNEDE